MRFKKSNCRKKTVFSQPDVPALVAVGVKYLLSFRLKTDLCKYKTNYRLNLKPQLLQTCVGGCHNFLHSNFQVSFSFKIFVKCLFYWYTSLIYFGISLIYFFTRLIYFGISHNYFFTRLIYFGGCNIYFGIRLIQFRTRLIYFNIRLMQFCTSLMRFLCLTYFFEFNFSDCFILH